jgi:hypothetical protein
VSLKDFVDGVGRDILWAQAKGAPIVAMYLCGEGEKTLLEAAAKERNENLDIVPRYRIHGVTVKVHEGLPRGHVWYVHKGGKK